MSQKGFFYADPALLEPLCAPERAVLLIGSYTGYPNFGDVLQLKGVMRWHRTVSRLEPVVFIQAAAITGPDFLLKVRRWLGTDGVVVWSPELLDMAPLGLRLLDNPPRVSFLHVYGGGFLNRYWAADMLGLIESACDSFGVGHYVLSGQQVSVEAQAAVAEHFKKYPPLLAGGRDLESAAILDACGAPAADSFDDALEALQAMVGQVTRRPDGVLVHMNASSYTYAQELEQVLRGFAERLAELDRARTGPDEPVTLLEAYNDRRVHEVADTLAVVGQLEASFPFRRYEVLELGRWALDLWTGDPFQCVLNGRVGMVSSYHVALFCALAGVPVLLQSSNDYYAQKKRALGYDHRDFAGFLKDPIVPDLSARLAAREPWLARLAATYGIPARPASPRSNASGPSLAAWQPKVGLSSILQQRGWLEEQRARWQVAAEQAVHNWNERGAWIAELEQVNVRLVGTTEAQEKAFRELQAANELLTRQLADREKVIQEQAGYIAELQEARAWLLAQVERRDPSH